MRNTWLSRIADVAVDAVYATAIHLRRIARLLSSALAGSVGEVRELLWEYRALALPLCPRGDGHLNVGPVEMLWSTGDARGMIAPTDGRLGPRPDRFAPPLRWEPPFLN